MGASLVITVMPDLTYLSLSLKLLLLTSFDFLRLFFYLFYLYHDKNKSCIFDVNVMEEIQIIKLIIDEKSKFRKAEIGKDGPKWEAQAHSFAKVWE
jgi:hypothetical protein